MVGDNRTAEEKLFGDAYMQQRGSIVVPEHTKVPEHLRGAALPPTTPGHQPDFNFVVTLPGEMAKYGPDIQRFVDAMVYKLEKNLPKGKWEQLGLQRAFELLELEVKELRDELFDEFDKPIRPNMVKGLLECADVANFALIIASIIMERGK